MKQKSYHSLGPLEKEMLEILWRKGGARVRELYDILKNKRKVVHTSVAVLLDRLHERRLVTRKVETCRGGYRYIYYPASEKEQFQRKELRTAVNNLIERFGDTATTYFDERFSKKTRRRMN